MASAMTIGALGALFLVVLLGIGFLLTWGVCHLVLMGLVALGVPFSLSAKTSAIAAGVVIGLRFLFGGTQTRNSD